MTLPSVSRQVRNNEREPTMPNRQQEQKKGSSEKGAYCETLDGDAENCNGFAGRGEEKKRENKESFFGFLLDFVVETGIGWG